MATAGRLVTSALKKARVLGIDQTPTAVQMQDGLESLNWLLDSLWIERLAVPYELNENFSWVSGQASRTIGVGGNFVTTRPVKIVSAFVRDSSGYDHPVRVAKSRDEYDAVCSKSQTGRPDLIYYEPGVVTGTIYAYPVPDQTYTIYLNSHKRIESFAAHTEAADLLPGYERMIVHNLAVELSANYGKEILPSVQAIAISSKRALKNFNAPTHILDMPSGLPGTEDHHFNILTG